MFNCLDPEHMRRGKHANGARSPLKNDISLYYLTSETGEQADTFISEGEMWEGPEEGDRSTTEGLD